MRKTILGIAVASLLGFGMAGIAAAPANAVSPNACNQGTYNAWHVQLAPSQGIPKIVAAACPHGD